MTPYWPCGVPVRTDDYWPTACAMPRGHRQRFHLDASHICVWCDRNVVPEGRGDFAPAMTDGGAVMHRCLFALGRERVGVPLRTVA